MNTTQTNNKAYCRGLNYYVNPDSIEVVELGSQKFPYKSLSLPFVEILNYFSHKAVTVNIYVKENTTNYLLQSFNYVINMTAVNILTYSATGSSSSSATIICRDENVTLFDATTKYNLLSNADLNLTIVSYIHSNYVLNTEK